ncbi:MAG: hypothetical protein ACI8TX_002586 [Hyphomicrobiaceae bacterium]|jgi:uncharacterized protein YqeY
MTEDTLRAELKTAMRERDGLRTRVLRNVLAAVKNKQIEKRADVPTSEIVAIIQREAKQSRETLTFARDAGRDETVADLELVLGVLDGLLPSQLSEDELVAAIRAIVTETGAAGLGDVMKELIARHAGTYDGKTASRLVREILA